MQSKGSVPTAGGMGLVEKRACFESLSTWRAGVVAGIDRGS